MTSLPAGTVTFLFTDVEGSTRLWEEKPEEMGAAMSHHEQVLATAVEDHEGHVVKFLGDGVHAVFASARAAVAAAVACQLELNRAVAAGPELRARMGLHTGEAELLGGDYYGPSVNRAARLADAGHGGQIIVSLATEELVRDSLARGVSLRDLGDHRLKDLSHPERVFQVDHPDLSAGFPPLRSLDAQPNNLPLLLESFVGRRADIDRIVGQLAESRLVTLTGASGAGKTRLALEVAAELVDLFPDGVWMVELAPLDAPTLVGAAIAEAVGVEPQPDRPAVDTLRQRLAESRMLLVLDNCEHLLAAAADTAGALLRTCRHLRILATSREPLGLPGESAAVVQPLQYPVHPPGTVEELLEFEAARLFAERAQSVLGGFHLTADLVEPVATICTNLDGIPLALELAAARTRVLTVDQIAARLDEQLGLLSGYSAADKRHQAMRVALDWSYELLDAGECDLFEGLSVFRGGATLEAVESICAEPGSTAVLDLLDGLVAKSMVIADPTAHGMRYRLLEPLRQYAEEKLAATRMPEVVARHWDWYERYSRETEPKVRGRDQLEWLERVEAEHDNLRIALDRAFAADEIDTCASIAGSLCWFWFLHSHVEDSERWLPRLIEAGAGTTPRPYIRLLLAAGQYSWELGRTEQARELIGRVLSMAEESKSQTLAAWGNAYASILEVFDEDFATADRHREVAAELFAAVNSIPGRGFVAWLRAFSASVRIGRDGLGPGDDLDALLAGMDPVVAGARRLGDRNFLAHALWTVADLQRLRGDTTGSTEALVESTLALHELGNKYCLTHHLDGAALLAFGGGDTTRAVRLLAASDALRQRLGTPGSPLEQRLGRELRSDLDAAMDPEAFQAAWAEGSRLGIDDAVALATRTEPPSG